MFEWLSVTFQWGFWRVSLSYYVLFGLLGNSIYSLLIIIRSQIGTVHWDAGRTRPRKKGPRGFSE
jgi:hypothetical protein